MSDEETRHLSDRLRQRFQREIDLDVEVDASLIGGAIIRARDQVIDGSVRGQLKRLARQVAA
jgi:F-type H+-transporting ATPase subunit delta